VMLAANRIGPAGSGPTRQAPSREGMVAVSWPSASSTAAELT
jgi:hypothetical protein